MIGLRCCGVKTVNFGFSEKKDQEINYPKKIFYHLKTFRKIILEKNQKNTVLFYYNRFGLFELPLFYILRKKGVKIIVDLVEDVSLNAYQKNFLQKCNQFINKLIFQNIHKFVDGLVVVSNQLKKIAETSLRQKDRVFLLPISYDPQKIRNTNTQKAKSTTFFYGGNYGEKENLVHVIKNFNKLCKSKKNIKLVLTGIPDKKTSLYIDKNIKSNKRILFKGYLKEKEYNAEVNKSTIFIIPRKNTDYANAGFPFKLAEYMAAGKPVLCSMVGDLRQVLPKNSVVFYKPDSLSDLIKKMRFLVNDRDVRSRIGLCAKKTAKKLFNRERQAVQLKKWLLSRFFIREKNEYSK